MKSAAQIFRSPEADLVPSGGDHSTATLRLNFRDAPLRNILHYLSEAGGLLVEAETNVETDRRMDLWTEELVNREEAVSLFKKALTPKGYAAIHKGCRLAILRSQDAKKQFIPLPALS